MPAHPDSLPNLEIPELSLDRPSDAGIAEQVSLHTAAQELEGFRSGKLTPRQASAEWSLRFILRTFFFFFALLINLWWANNVRLMLWQAGRVNSGFHLSNSVLIVLLTTSIANFLALLTIIATHLFRKEAGEKKGE